MLFLKVKRLTKTAKLPIKDDVGNAGWDLFADCLYDLHGNRYTLSDYAEGFHVVNDAIVKIGVGIAVEFPKEYVLVIFDRSGYACNKGLHRVAGVVDSNYRGEITLCLKKLCEVGQIMISQGDKIAQFLMLPVPRVKVLEIDVLEESDRGVKGFGSSG